MNLELTEKHVLITGGSRGIGYACAQEFLREGCRVSLVGRDLQRVQQASSTLDATGTKVSGFEADLADAASALRVIKSAEDAGGPIDILINCAGSARRTPFAELDPELWHQAMAAKFFAYINVIDPLIKLMGARGTGSIVSIIGMGGKVPITTHLPGGAANAALMLATAGLAHAYGPKGVRVNAVNPARTSTSRVAEGVEAEARQKNMSAAAVLSHAQENLPLGRLARPDEIAAVVAFLASPRSSYVSGAILSMDGAATPMVV